MPVLQCSSSLRGRRALRASRDVPPPAARGRWRRSYPGRHRRLSRTRRELAAAWEAALVGVQRGWCVQTQKARIRKSSKVCITTM